jgi:hypothetical protein
MQNEQNFTVSVVGELSGETFRGDFKVRKLLSHRQQLAYDAKRRELLGTNPNGTSNRADSLTEVFAQLSVRIVEAPSWWVESGGGMDLIDDNVVIKVFEQTMLAEREAREAIAKRAEESKAALGKIAQQ